MTYGKSKSAREAGVEVDKQYIFHASGPKMAEWDGRVVYILGSGRDVMAYVWNMDKQWPRSEASWRVSRKVGWYEELQDPDP